MTTSDRSPRASTVVCLLGLLLAVRLLLIVCLSDVFFYGEELEKGTAAKALLDGVDWPYHQLAYHLYEGGGFVISHLTALAFLLVGQSILAIKLVALLFGGLVLWAGIRLCGRHFGSRSAWLFGLLMVFGPASFQKLSLLSLGIHFEACLFLLLVIDATLTLLELPRTDATATRPVATLGLALGFGFFFNYQLALAGLWCTLWLLARRPRIFTGRSLVVGLGCLLVGLAPLLAMATQVGGQVFDIHGTPLATVQNNGPKVAAFMGSLYVDRSLQDLFGVLLYPLAFLGALTLLLARARGPQRRNALRLATFLALWSAVYLSSGFVVGEVQHPFQLLRFAPVWVLATVTIAAGLDALLGSTRSLATRTGWAACVLLVGWGVRSTVAVLRAGSPSTWGANWTLLRTTKGYDYAGYFAKVFPRLENGEQRGRVLTGFDEPHPMLLRADFAQALSEHERWQLLEALEQFPAMSGNQSDFVLGLGPLGARLARRDIPATLALAADLPELLRPSWGRAVGRFGRAYAEFPERMQAEIEALQPGSLRADYLRGMGYRAWRRFVIGPFGTARFQLKPHRVLQWLEGLPQADRPDLREGFELGARLHSLGE
ncbi:MAG: hypothetical protein ACI8QZ_000455 [Chlamydiales bacterium]|jgi:hypothetical protein